jgi:hypothetical protein
MNRLSVVFGISLSINLLSNLIYPTSSSAQGCQIGKLDAPSRSTKEIKHEYLGFSFKIPTNYKATRISGSTYNKRNYSIQILNPSEERFIQCLGGDPDGPTVGLMVKIEDSTNLSREFPEAKATKLNGVPGITLSNQATVLSKFHMPNAGNILSVSYHPSIYEGSPGISAEFTFSQVLKTFSFGSCLKWSEFVKELPKEGGRGGQWWSYGSMPSSFESGCFLLADSNAIDTGYILKKGVTVENYLGETPSYAVSSRVPSFGDNEKKLEKLVNEGSAIMVTWLTPTNGSLPYLRKMPRNQTFQREDGMTCYSTVCIKGGGFSFQTLSRVLKP